jgi:formate hydrogenlyase transcriptional activator
MDDAPPAGTGGKLLVIGDDLELRKPLEAFLAREGYTVSCAPSGQSALMLSRDDPPELILLNAHLPDMDGCEVCRRLRQDSATQAIPVIFISGLDGAVDKLRGFAAGGVDVIAKPFQADEILARIGTHLSLKRLRDRLVAQNENLEAEIAKSRKTEEALRQARDELERRVQARTAELGSANTRLVASQRELAERLKFETVLSDISARFINLPPEKLDVEIESGLRMVLEFFQVDRCGLLRILPQRDAWEITHLANSQHGTPLPVGTVLSRSINPWAYDRLTKLGKVVQFTSLDDVPDEALVDKQTWKDWGIRSNLVIPIFTDKKIVHVIAINAVEKERAWPGEFIPRLQLLGEIFVNALERRKTEQILRDSEERLNLAAASAGSGLWVIYADSGQLWATEKLREILRFSPDEELNFERFLERVHPDDRQGARETLDACLQTREMVMLEFRILLPDGSVRWVAASGRSFHGNSEQPERVMGVTTDITERKRMEVQLQERLREIEALKHRLEKENVYLQEEIELLSDHAEIVGQSSAVKQFLGQAEQVAPTDAAVLVLGETGTGKELLARAIHRMSNRRDRPLVTVNCATLPPTLVESELFGREKGAYTGAMTRLVGRFELADGSTLFLDEVGEIPPEIQPKLLRVLEEGRFERLGSTRSLKADVRIIAATNRDLARDVDEGRFRKDLYYRLNVFPISIPPLRERLEDLPQLVWAFIQQFEKKIGKRIDSIPSKCMRALESYSWPGNVRELRNVIERAMIVSRDGKLAIDLPQQPRVEAPEPTDLNSVNRRLVLSVLNKTNWRISGRGGAAEILGLKRTTLQSLMKRLGIKRPAP